MSADVIDLPAAVPAQLRPYQQRVIDGVDAEIAGGRRRLLVVAPTGSGKTVIASALISRAVDAGKRVLFLAHRRELIQQASAKIYAAGIDHGIIQAGFGTRPGIAVQVASVPTLHARAIRSSAMDVPPADVVIVDEAHHVRADSYQDILKSYPDAIVIGLTATPCRGDGGGLGNAFECIVECAPVAELIAGGYLVPAKIYAPTQPDLTGVKVARGDYVEKQLQERVDRPELVGDIIGHWLRLGERRPTVVFATGVAHSVHLRDEFLRAGVMAAHVDGTTPTEERDRIIGGLASGAVEIVCNAMVLTEGWDCPAASCLVMARPTKSLGLYRQMVGRVLRPAPGKVDALIIDHAGAAFAHGFPDDPIEWTLRTDQRAVNRAHQKRGKHKSPSLTTCPECTAVRLQGRACTVCNWRPQPKPDAVAVADGELAQLDRSRVAKPVNPDAAERRQFHQQLAYIAQERGYKPGWAAFKYKEKYGGWPPDRFVEPMAPEPWVRSWVRSRQIAYAKAMDKRGVAA